MKRLAVALALLSLAGCGAQSKTNSTETRENFTPGTTKEYVLESNGNVYTCWTEVKSPADGEQICRWVSPS